MYSMTGFGRSTLEIDGRKVTIELKSVNHRYLDINMRLHRSVSFAEDTIRCLLKQSLKRGHIDIYLYYENLQDDTKIVEIDINLAKSYYNAFKQLDTIIDSNDTIQISDIAKMPDVLSVLSKDDDEEQVIKLIEQAMGEAISAMLDMRKHEGDKQEIDILDKLAQLEASLEIIKALAPTVVAEYRTKLTARVSELLNNSNIEVDANRLSTEVAFFADKSSIDEEITRLYSHFSLMKVYIKKDEPVGRQLDFVVQEINREVNTICSKSSNTDITNSALEMKNTVEKIREQVQNIQ